MAIGTFPPETYEGIITETYNGVEMDVYQDRPRTIVEMLAATVAKFGDREALVDDRARLTFQELEQRCNNLAGALQSYGVKKGDRVAILMSNCWEYVVTYYANARLGAINVLLNWRCAGPELEYMLKDSGAKVLLMGPEFWDTINGIRDKVNSLETVFVTGQEIPEGAKPYADLLKTDPGRLIVADSPVTEDDGVAILYTSGTTGVPKGALQTHRNYVANAVNASRLTQADENIRQLIIAPMFHATAINSQTGLGMLKGGCSIIRSAFDPMDTLTKIQEEKITYGAGVATMFWVILNMTPYQDFDTSSLRKFTFGGSPVPVELFNQMVKAFPTVEFSNVYGLTEATSISTWNTHQDILRIPESVGPPVPVLQAKIIDPQNGSVLPPREVGEVCIKGPTVVQGYWNKPEANEKTFVDGWVHTGDLGCLDEDGYVYIVDRLKDMIVSGGENIYCIEVENAIMQHPAVMEVAVVGVPDSLMQEAVKAVIFLKPGMTATEEEIIEHCKKHIASYKKPKYVVFNQEMLPKNPSGKVIKSALKKL